jgi:hypothetical protein
MAQTGKHLKQTLDPGYLTVSYSFDVLAKGIAEGTLSRGCYGLKPSKVIARCRKRHAKATKCRPATVVGSRS